MKKYEYGQLSKRKGRDGFYWLLFYNDDEFSVGGNVDDLEVLNLIGKDGWQVAYQMEFNEQMGTRELMMLRQID